MSVCLASSLLFGLSLQTWRKGKAQPSPEDPTGCFCNKTWTFAPSPGTPAGSVTQTPTKASASPSHVQFPSKLSDTMKGSLHNKQLGPCPTQGHLWMRIAVHLTLRPSNPLHTGPTLSSGPGWAPAAAGSTPSLCQVATPGHTTYVQIAPLSLPMCLTREELALSPLAQHEGICPHIKLPMAFFTARAKKFTIRMGTQKTSNSQSSLERKKNGAGEINLPNFRNILQSYRLCYRATVIKTAWCWHGNRRLNPWNQMESSDINPHTYGHRIFDKAGKICDWEKVVSSIREGNGIPLQYSCLENPMDGGAWWAAVYGVARSQTRLKRL